MRTHSILAVLLAGLVLAPLLSPRPASAATATVTYNMVPGGANTYIDAVTGPIPKAVTGGTLTVNLVGITVVPFVSANWTHATITWLVWATAARPGIGLTPPAAGPAGGYGKITGPATWNGTFTHSPPLGIKTLIDPYGPLGPSRTITVTLAALGGSFNAAGTGAGQGHVMGWDSGAWYLGGGSGSLTEVSSSISIVPEPSTGLLLGLGLAGLAAFGRRLHGGGRKGIMRTHSILAVLLAGLVLGSLLSPRPASAATATVTYAIAFGATYSDATVPMPPGAGNVMQGSLTVHLVGATLTPNVKASWTQGWVTGLTWATMVRPSPPNLALVGYVPGLAGGTGTAGGNGNFNLMVPAGNPWLVDYMGLGNRPITFAAGNIAGGFNGAGGGLGSVVATGWDMGAPWFLTGTGPPGGLMEVASSISIVPEPSTGLLLGLGLAGLAAFGRRLHGGGRQRA